MQQPLRFLLEISQDWLLLTDVDLMDYKKIRDIVKFIKPDLVPKDRLFDK